MYKANKFWFCDGFLNYFYFIYFFTGRLLPRSVARLVWFRNPKMWWTTLQKTLPSSLLLWGWVVFCAFIFCHGVQLCVFLCVVFLQ